MTSVEESLTTTDDSVDYYFLYDNPDAANPVLDKIDLLNVVVVRGSGVTTFVDSMLQTTKGIKIYVGCDSNNIGRFGYCHVSANDPSITSEDLEYSDIPSFDRLLNVTHNNLAHGREPNEFNVYQILESLRQTIEHRKQQYTFDSSLIHQNVLDVFIDDYSNLSEQLGVEYLNEYIRDVVRTGKYYKVRFWLGVNSKYAPELLELLGDIEYTDVLIGDGVDNVLYMTNQLTVKLNGRAVGLVNHTPTVLRLPSLYWVDGVYRRTNLAIAYKWQERLRNSPVVRTTRATIRLSPGRNYRYSLKPNSVINLPVELQEEDVLLPGESFPLTAVNPNILLSEVFNNLKNTYESVGLPEYMVSKLYLSAVEYVVRVYGHHESMQSKAVTFVRLHPDLLISMVFECTPIIKESETLVSRTLFRLLSRRSLAECNKLTKGLRKALIDAELPTSKEGLVTVFTMANFIAQRLEKLGEHYLNNRDWLGR